MNRDPGDETPSPSDDVLDWRFDQLLRVGLDPELALVLADTRVDLRLIEDMLQKGCSSRLLAAILL